MTLSSENLIALLGVLGMVGGVITWLLRFQDRNDTRMNAIRLDMEKMVDLSQAEYRGHINELKERLFAQTNWARDSFVPYKAFDDLRLEIRREFRDLKMAVGRIATRSDDDDDADRVERSAKATSD